MSDTQDTLIERLRQYEGRQFETTVCCNGLRDEAATALADRDAKIAELQGLFKIQSNAHAEHIKALLSQHEYELGIYAGAGKEERARAEAAEAQVAELTQKLERAMEALQLAVNMVMSHEPGDSRAVSSEAVALAAVTCGCDDDACWQVIDRALNSGASQNG